MVGKKPPSMRGSTARPHPRLGLCEKAAARPVVHAWRQPGARMRPYLWTGAVLRFGGLLTTTMSLSSKMTSTGSGSPGIGYSRIARFGWQ
eukprot:363607-Chlamydomonas_euryale.AAC.3